jgi:hypothetical protein
LNGKQIYSYFQVVYLMSGIGWEVTSSSEQSAEVSLIIKQTILTQRNQASVDLQAVAHSRLSDDMLREFWHEFNFPAKITDVHIQYTKFLLIHLSPNLA